MIRIRLNWGLSGIEIKTDAPYSPDVADDLVARVSRMYADIPEPDSEPIDVTEPEES